MSLSRSAALIAAALIVLGSGGFGVTKAADASTDLMWDFFHSHMR